MFHLKTELKTTPQREKEPERTPVKPYSAQREEGRREHTKRALRIHAKNTGGV